MALADGRMHWELTDKGDATTDRYRVEAIMSEGSKSTRAAYSALKWMNVYGISAYEMLGLRTPNNVLQHMIWNPKSSGKFKEWIEGELGAAYGTRDFIKRFIQKVAHREGLVGEWMADGVENAAKMLRRPSGEVRYHRRGRAVGLGSLPAPPSRFTARSSTISIVRRLLTRATSQTRFAVSPIATIIYCLGSRQMGPNNHTCTELYEESQQNSRGHCYKFAHDERAACRYLDKDGNPVLFGQSYLPDMENFYTLDGKRSEPVPCELYEGPAAGGDLLHGAWSVQRVALHVRLHCADGRWLRPGVPHHVPHSQER